MFHLRLVNDIMLKRLLPSVHKLLSLIDDSSKKNQLKKAKLKLYSCSNHSFRSLLCTGFFEHCAHQCCASCSALEQENSLRMRVWRARNPVNVESSHNPYMSNSCKTSVCVPHRMCRQVSSRIHSKTKVQCVVLAKLKEANAIYFKRAESACVDDDVLKMIQWLTRAHKSQSILGNKFSEVELTGTRKLQLTLAGRLCRIISDPEFTDTDKNVNARPFSTASHDMYTYLLALGGPNIHFFVSKLLGGPALRTTQAYKATLPIMQCGFLEAQIMRAADVLKKIGLKNAVYHC
jgi:hypothetical protein